MAAYEKLAPEARAIVRADPRIAEDPTSRGSDTIPEAAKTAALTRLVPNKSSALYKKDIIAAMDAFIEAGGSDDQFGAILREPAAMSLAKPAATAKPKAKKSPAAEEQF